MATKLRAKRRQRTCIGSFLKPIPNFQMISCELFQFDKVNSGMKACELGLYSGSSRRLKLKQNRPPMTKQPSRKRWQCTESGRTTLRENGDASSEDRMSIALFFGSKSRLASCHTLTLPSTFAGARNRLLHQRNPKLCLFHND